ncbi:exonuclease 3'-5' domain-containing protein 1 [Mytilus galloprovincialis]|uniref:Exonuclease 3'-5' domain-containing protein 1 n=1 Tax=Mytilus galloprovincialis TaxID=29158 RepID=A0A8B6GUT5_MYTGA|nr:exonuclease 3'-5' domain-containing protein 1 [Mytilus galloprovincialis]
MASNPKVEIITETDRCLRIVEHLSECDFIALDAEGINLGKEGPLTLLQIGTVDDNVYLFDIVTNKDLFRKGKLEDILQSDKPVKVIHACAGDSAALYHQFGIQLKNVFDTQVANIIIEETKGRRIPTAMKLSDVCQMYSDKAKPLDQKDLLKVKLKKEDGELWARRPLTAEMIEYASNDVTALIPTVYLNQKRILNEKALLAEYEKRVQDEVNYHIDDAASQRKRIRVDGIVQSVLKDIEDKYGNDTRFQDLTDDDEIKAIQNCRYDQEIMSPFINQLKIESIKARLQELSDQLSTEGNNFLPKGQSYGYLRAYQYLPDKDIHEEAKRLQNALETIFLADMVNKYSPSTNINVITQYEKDALRNIRPRNKNDNRIDPVHLSLYWQMHEKDLDFEIERLQISGRRYNIPQGKYKWLKYNCSDNVPDEIKRKAKRHIVNLDKTFGKGKYSA